MILDPEDQRFQGAQQSSNNTRELIAIAETLIWLRDEAPGTPGVPAEIAYDSHFAANLAEPHCNHALAQKAHALYLEVQAQRTIACRWVKGHSNVPGNDRADALANLGRRQQLGKHSRSWAAPKTGALIDCR